MRFKKDALILVLILILATVLRFWHLGLTPPSPDWDEAALGYNAYSLMQTGGDEYGERWPLILRSFDDYKPAIYVYLVIPAIKLFGLNTFAVRFPAALFGTLTVLLLYLLVKELFIGNQRLDTRRYALFAAGLLAISPWHLQFSRVAFESNVGMGLDILWAIFFLKGLKRPIWLILAAIFAGLNLYVYQAEKVFVPLLGLLLVTIYYRQLRSVAKSYLLVSIAVGLLLTVPLLRMSLTRSEIFLRAKGTSLTADQTPFLSRTVQKLVTDQKNQDFLGLILDNRRVVYGLAFLDGYLSHFNFNWLFLTGDEARHHAPNMGLLYLFELPFLLGGVYFLVSKNFSLKTKLLIFGWFLLAPIPASFTSGVPHAVRTLRLLPMLIIFTALGITGFLQEISRLKIRWQWLTKGVLICLGLFNFTYYLDQYFVQQNYLSSASWQYGYQQAIDEIKLFESKYDRVVVSNEPPLDQSYMFFLFYLKHDPKKYQQEGGTVSGGFAENHRGFDKYTFRPINWTSEEKNGTLFVGRPGDFPSESKVLKIIYFLDGQEAIKIVEG